MMKIQQSRVVAAHWGKVFQSGLLGVCLLWSLGSVRAEKPALGIPTAEITIGIHRIAVEVAHTPQNRQLGLMKRSTLATNHGMLFIFPQDKQHCMWMRNTLIPLSVAFIDASGQILNIEDMKPQSDDDHCSIAAARYALEMNQGWFAERGIRPGLALKGLDRLPLPF